MEALGGGVSESPLHRKPSLHFAGAGANVRKTSMWPAAILGGFMQICPVVNKNHSKRPSPPAHLPVGEGIFSPSPPGDHGHRAKHGRGPFPEGRWEEITGAVANRVQKHQHRLAGVIENGLLLDLEAGLCQCGPQVRQLFAIAELDVPDAAF